MFSKACEYSFRAALHIAQHSERGERVGLKQIAADTDSPVAFTAKVLQQLVREGVIRSVKGPSGGFEMTTQQMNEVKLCQIVSTIDGDHIYSRCCLGMKTCDENRPCPVHNQYKLIRDELQLMLERTSVYDLAQGPWNGLTPGKH